MGTTRSGARRPVIDVFVSHSSKDKALVGASATCSSRVTAAVRNDSATDLPSVRVLVSCLLEHQLVDRALALAAGGRADVSMMLLARAPGEVAVEVRLVLPDDVLFVESVPVQSFWLTCPEE
jgi:hypothetical protein